MTPLYGGPYSELMDKQDDWRRDAEGSDALFMFLHALCADADGPSSALALASELVTTSTTTTTTTIDQAHTTQQQQQQQQWQQRLLQLKKQADSIHHDLPPYERRKQAETLKELEEKLKLNARQASIGTTSSSTSKPNRFLFGRNKKADGELNSVRKEATAVAATENTGVREAIHEDVAGATATATSIAHTTTTLEHITFASITSSSYSFSGLKQCIVDLRRVPQSSGSPTPTSLQHTESATVPALYLENISDCLVVAPSVAGSVLIHDAKDCVVVVSCHQFRMHRSRNVKVIIDIDGTSILEQCEDVQFVSWQATIGTELKVEDFDAPHAHDGIDKGKSWQFLSDSVKKSILHTVAGLPQLQLDAKAARMDAERIRSTLAALKSP